MEKFVFYKYDIWTSSSSLTKSSHAEDNVDDEDPYLGRIHLELDMNETSIDFWAFFTQPKSFKSQEENMQLSCNYIDKLCQSL